MGSHQAGGGLVLDSIAPAQAKTVGCDTSPQSALAEKSPNQLLEALVKDREADVNTEMRIGDGGDGCSEPRERVTEQLNDLDKGSKHSICDKEVTDQTFD